MSWVMNIGKESNKNEVGIGIVLENLLRVLIEEAVRLEGKITNNEAEYKALLYRLELTLRLGVQHLKINLDSELVSGQLVGAFEAKDSQMKSYYNTAKSLMTKFKLVKVEAIKQELNSQADALVKGASYGEYWKKIELIMKENLTEGKKRKKTL